MSKSVRALAGVALLVALGACQPAAAIQNAAAGKSAPAAASPPVTPPSTTTTTRPTAAPTTGNARCDAFPRPLSAARDLGWTVDCTQPGSGSSRGVVLGGQASFGKKRITIWLDTLRSPAAIEYMLWHEVAHALGHDHPDTDKVAHCQMDPSARAGIQWDPGGVPTGDDCRRLAV